MVRTLIPILVSFLLLGCGAQNVAFVSQSFRADHVAFSEIAEGEIQVNGLDSSRLRFSKLIVKEGDPYRVTLLQTTKHYDAKAFFSDSGVGLDPKELADINSFFRIDNDSLSQLCLDALRQLRFDQVSHLQIVDKPSGSGSASAQHELRIRNIGITGPIKKNLNFKDDIPNTIVAIDLEMIDNRSGAILFRIQSSGEVVTSVYDNPWKKAVYLAMARIVEYIQSGGEKYAHPES